LWSGADILRGSLDPTEYRQPVMTLLFIKRLNDTFEENAEKLIKEGKSQKEAYENNNRHYFFLPKDARWSVLSSSSYRNDDDKIIEKFEPVNVRDEFEYAFKMFWKALEVILPKKEADPYLDDFKYAGKVRQMIRTLEE
jgi:type I restriction-modification system DNA methylase subunit